MENIDNIIGSQVKSYSEITNTKAILTEVVVSKCFGEGQWLIGVKEVF